MSPIHALNDQLFEILNSFRIDEIQFGFPKEMEQVEKETRHLCQKVAKGSGLQDKKMGYEVARKYLNGEIANKPSYELDVLAAAICENIAEANQYCPAFFHVN